ncbi:MAG TPA: Wzz/FepE/Etk N-terminal domain-containing protein, partial [Ignavibacteriaceae bacterium]
MAEYRGFDMLDYLIILVKWKKFLILQSLILLVASYLFIFFFIPPQYDSSALIVAVEDQGLNPVSSISKTLGNLPFASL